jgi:hypothetical protein
MIGSERSPDIFYETGYFVQNRELQRWLSPLPSSAKSCTALMLENIEVVFITGLSLCSLTLPGKARVDSSEPYCSARFLHSITTSRDAAQVLARGLGNRRVCNILVRRERQHYEAAIDNDR